MTSPTPIPAKPALIVQTTIHLQINKRPRERILMLEAQRAA